MDVPRYDKTVSPCVMWTGPSHSDPMPCRIQQAMEPKEVEIPVATEPENDDNGSEAAIEVVMGERRQLLSLTYRFLGSLAEAEDAVQETYVRWCALSRAEQAAIESPAAWLRTVASRICLNMLGSARLRRQSYVGQWLPEPLPEHAEWLVGRFGDTVVDPADRVTLDESVSMAFLVVLESMTPAERVTFILHDVFQFRFTEVAETVGRSPAACRQLAASARRRVRVAAATPASADVRARLVGAFKDAWEAGDIDALIGLLDPDATVVADGGGLGGSVTGGREAIARACLDLAERTPGLTILERAVNGQPGLISSHEGVTRAVLAFHITGEEIKHIWAVFDPETLTTWRRT